MYSIRSPRLHMGEPLLKRLRQCRIVSLSPPRRRPAVAVRRPKNAERKKIALSAPSILNDKESIIHPITWSSTTITKACRSTLMAETFAMTKGTEAGTRIRAAIVDAKGQLDIRNWEESAAEAIGHIWLTDCDSLYEHPVST